ncbi:MAG: metallophosphatase family protein [Gammaproteobacteria bacterium]|nr:metallophosphatase family protein [Gammaproteobacteria bacterium]MDH5651669.1 metallophosphatase family protein [Gammaproteobacteria bacterium]
MKIAVISDIHSNLEALLACIKKANKARVEQFICLGDVVGYGPEPAETLEVLRSLPGFVMVRGNHEDALFTPYYKSLRQHIRQSIDWTRDQLSAEQMAYLKQLPMQYELPGALMVHASAHKPERWSYVYNNEKAHKCIKASGKPITFIGHTHQPQIYFEMPNGKIECLTPRAGVAIPLYQRGRYVINVGSVGQPRDENNAAGFVVYNTAEREVTFHRIAYEYRVTAQKILERGLPNLFAERLQAGN